MSVEQTSLNFSAGGQPLMHLDGMYKQWFMDYSTYVIVDRAVPHINDGLKPVQRRILHSLFELEDGRYNKVANSVGNTMKYHPHGDASIYDALVGLGQKELLIDTQGNWGNIYSGDPAAAARYIEARLSKFALEAVFNPKTTQWVKTYDERNDEPVTLPVKFPLLLAQGVEGIAVGLSCKVLPHNFIELLDAGIAHLRGQPFSLMPDFPTGGLTDCSNYQDGQRGGRVRVRAKIEVRSSVLLVISEIPFGTVVPGLIASIVHAHEKGKIKIKSIDDNTSSRAEILVNLPPESDPEVVKNALYAFTDCEQMLYPNAVVIVDKKPVFTSVLEILRISTERTRELLGLELQIKLSELEARWHSLSLEKIFIEKRIYHKIEECETWESVLATIDAGLKLHIKHLKSPVTQEDCAKLTEIKIKRITRFDSKGADDDLKKLVAAIEETKEFLEHLTQYTISWFKNLKKKYSAGRERRTELSIFNTITAAKVARANLKPFVSKKAGFIGWDLKRDEDAEPLGDCSDLDEVLALCRDGNLKVNKVAEKEFFGNDIIYARIFQREDTATIYNLIYEEKESGKIYAKRFHMGEGITRNRPYPVANGKILFFYAAAIPEDAPAVTVMLKEGQTARTKEVPFDFSTLAIKGRLSQGNLVTKLRVHRVIKSATKR